jgi:very-short-patch-repair endonuclease
MPHKITRYDPALKVLARKLRKESTLSEVLLWRQIKARKLGVEFHRQVPLDKYIVDFYCHEVKLAIEIDGSSHEIDTVYENDLKRQEQLESLGVTFIRFGDKMVKKDMTNVIAVLADRIAELTTPRESTSP